MADRFKSMDMATANKECGHKPEPYFDNCGACRQRVGIHCPVCKIQTTGCVCTDHDRFDPQMAWEATVQRLGERGARDAYERAGFIIPGEGLILP